MKRTRWAGIVLGLGLWLAGCGDAPTADSRSLFTKAPLERPGVVIRPEPVTEMSELGEPNLIPTVVQPGATATP